MKPPQCVCAHTLIFAVCVYFCFDVSRVKLVHLFVFVRLFGGRVRIMWIWIFIRCFACAELYSMR